MRHYQKDLGDKAPSEEQQAEAWERVARIAKALSGRERAQLRVADKRTLSLDLRAVWSVRSASPFRAGASLLVEACASAGLACARKFLLALWVEPAPRKSIISAQGTQGS